MLAARQKLWHAAECCALHDAHEAVRILLLHPHCQGELRLSESVESVEARNGSSTGRLFSQILGRRLAVLKGMGKQQPVRALMLLQRWQMCTLTVAILSAKCRQTINVRSALGTLR